MKDPNVHKPVLSQAKADIIMFSYIRPRASSSSLMLPVFWPVHYFQQLQLSVNGHSIDMKEAMIPWWLIYTATCP